MPQNIIYYPIITPQIVKPSIADGFQFVTTEGSDTNDGLSWGSAKLTIAAAAAALPISGGEIHVAAGVFPLSSTLQVGSETQPVVLFLHGSVIDINITNGTPGIALGNKGAIVGDQSNTNGLDNYGAQIICGATANVSALVTNLSHSGSADAAFKIRNLFIHANPAATVVDAIVWIYGVNGTVTLDDVLIEGGASQVGLLISSWPSGNGYINVANLFGVWVAGSPVHIISNGLSVSNITWIGGAITDIAGAGPYLKIAGSFAATVRGVIFLMPYFESFTGATGDFIDISNAQEIIINGAIFSGGPVMTSCVNISETATPSAGIFVQGNCFNGIATNAVLNQIDGYTLPLGSLQDFRYYYGNQDISADVVDSNAVFLNTTTVRVLNKTVYADQMIGSDIGAKINAATSLLTSGGTVDCRGFGAGIQSLSTTIAMNQEGVTYLFDSSTTVQAGASNVYINAGASNIRIRGLTYDAQNGTYSGRQSLVLGTIGTPISDIFVDDCTFLNGQNSDGNGTIEIFNISNFAIRNCVMTGSLDAGILITGLYGNVTYGNITGNQIDMTGAGSTSTGIALHSQGSGNSISFVTVTNNVVSNSPDFAIEFGSFGGNNADGISVVGNSILLPAVCNGGISAAGASNSTIASNSVDGSSAAAAIAGIEAVGVSNVSITGNSVSLGASSKFGISCGVSTGTGNSNVSITGNVINGFGSSASYAGIYLGADSVSTITQTTISDNVVVFPTSGAGTGIWLQSNNSSGVISYISVQGNTIIGQGARSGDSGISLSPTSGTVEFCVVQNNTIYDLVYGVYNAGTSCVLSNNTSFSCTYGTYDIGATTNSAIVAIGAPPATYSTQAAVGIGGTTGIGNGSPGNIQAPAQSTGSGPATPGTIVGWIKISVAGTTAWVPFAE